MQTDHLDLWQLHSVRKVEEWDRGLEGVDQLPESFRLAREFGPMTAEEHEELLEQIHPRADLTLEWYKRR